jgi:hypothetical protein
LIIASFSKGIVDGEKGTVPTVPTHFKSTDKYRDKNIRQRTGNGNNIPDFAKAFGKKKAYGGPEITWHRRKRPKVNRCMANGTKAESSTKWQSLSLDRRPTRSRAGQPPMSCHNPSTRLNLQMTNAVYRVKKIKRERDIAGWLEQFARLVKKKNLVDWTKNWGTGSPPIEEEVLEATRGERDRVSTVMYASDHLKPFAPCAKASQIASVVPGQMRRQACVH